MSVENKEKLQTAPGFQGPLGKRSCTDVIFGLLFFVFLIVFGFAGYYAHREGDLNRLLIPRDSDGLLCGHDSEVVNKSVLLFFDLSKCADPFVPINGCPTTQVCFEKCPDENFFHDLKVCQSNLEDYKKKLLCSRNVDINTIKSCNDVERLQNEDKCAKWYLKSEPLGNRCLPSNIEDFGTIIDKSELILAISNIQLIGSINGVSKHIVEDTIQTWPILVVAFCAAAIFSLFVIFMMRWIAGPIVWVSVFGVTILLGLGTYFSWQQYTFYTKNPVDRYNLQPNLKSYINSYFAEARTWLIITCLVGFFFLLTVLLTIFLRKRIVLAIALIKEGSKAVSSNLTTVLFPIFPWVFQIAIIVLSVLMFLYLSSIGEPQYKVSGMNSTLCKCDGNYSTIKNGDACDPHLLLEHCKSVQPSTHCAASCSFMGLNPPTLVQCFKAINVIGFFWLLFFVSAFSEMVLAGTFAQWYWTLRKDDVPFFTLTTSIYRTIRFHLGTIAFGSLTIAICRIIRVALEFINAKLKKYDNQVTKAILCCCRCFFWCLESFLKFLNRNAYIMCSIHGKNFLGSAKDAFNLLMRNVLRVTALDKTTDFVFFLSKLLISLTISYAALAYYTSDIFSQHLPNVYVQYPFAQVFFIFIGSYFVSTVFFSVYSMAVDTLFLCFLEDCERNDGTEERPYFMSKQLMRILNKSNH